MRVPLLEEIEATIEAFRAGQDARIVMKMNSLADQACIEGLYRASQAGVPIELNVRVCPPYDKSVKRVLLLTQTPSSGSKG